MYGVGNCFMIERKDLTADFDGCRLMRDVWICNARKNEMFTPTNSNYCNYWYIEGGHRCSCRLER